MKKYMYLLTLLTALNLSSSLHASSPFTLLASIVGASDTSGGVRYTINKNWCIDGWASTREKTQNFWVGLYYTYFGISVSGSNQTALSTAFAYSVEHNFTKNIGLGIGTKIIEIKDSNIALLGGWDVYTTLKIPSFSNN